VLDQPSVKVTVLPVGWIAIRPPHREYAGPWPLRYPAILGSGRWAPWMPVLSLLVQTADATVLVDTGEAVDQPPGHFGCGAGAQERFYRGSLRIPVRAGTEAPVRLRRLGVDPRSVDTVVLTHLHSDHAGTVDAFPRAAVVVGTGERGGTGAVPCRLRHATVVEPDLADGPLGPFGASHALTDDGTVRVVPLPGHSPGHLGLVVSHRDGLLVAAGDAAFDHDQLHRRATSAVVHDPAENSRTQAVLASVLEDGGQVLLSHDLAAVTPLH
jgi:glyoxylase-like metal-dependent hydrolase (beta-lactamase superfamily II)